MSPSDVTRIVIHCSATKPTMDIGRAEIDRWHREKGWLMIGYHFVIRRDGAIEKGRPPSMAGAHADGWNTKSIGICLVGGIDKQGNPENNFTEDQFQSLAQKILELQQGGYDKALVLGHRDLPGVTKACPSFDVQAWMESVHLA